MSNLKNHKGLAIAHLNIRSLWRKLDILKINLQDDFDIDILGISESWLTKWLEDRMVDIPNYDILRCDRNWSDDNVDTNNGDKVKKRGGFCMYIKNDIHYSTHSMCMYNVSCKNVECQWVKILHDKQRNVIIGNIYIQTTSRKGQKLY